MGEEQAMNDDPLTAFSKFLNTTNLQYNNVRSSDLMSVKDYLIFLKASVVIRTAVCLMGICTNALNIRAFCRIGLDDSLTIVLFSLAVSDFISIFSTLIYIILTIAGIIDREHRIGLSPPPAILATLVAVALRAFTEVSNLTTVFLALQRCLCVTLPLQFKGIFSMSRVGCVMAAIWAIPVIITAALLYQHELVNTYDVSINASRFTMTFKPGREVMANLVYTMFGIVLNTTNQIVVFVCVFVLASALTKSVRFRQMTSKSATSAPTAGNNLQSESERSLGSPEVTSKKETTVNLSNTKEKQAIVQVALVSTIFLLCNTPRLAGSFAAMIDPRLDIHGEFHYFFTSLYVTNTLFENVNASVNFFVYLKYNTKFRSVCFRASIE